MILFSKDSRPDLQCLSGKPSDLKLHNQQLVVSLLSHGHPLSASELASQSSLSKTTISKILTELCRLSIVCSAGKGDSTSEGGKKPELFALNSALAATIVLSLFRRDTLRCAIVDLGGNILYQKDHLLEDPQSYEVLRREMLACISQAREAAASFAGQLCGIVISYAGIANAETGDILYPIQSFQSQYYPLREDLRRQVSAGIPVYVDNSCNYSGYAELLFDDNLDYEDITVMSFGDIVSCCILQQRNGYPRRRGIAGEFGHYILDPSAKDRCYCGCRGCLDALLSKGAVLNFGRQLCLHFPFSKVARQMEQGSIDVEEIIAAANDGDPFSQQILLRSVQYLALLIRNCCSLATVSKVIIQGFYARAGTHFRTCLLEELKKTNQLNIHGDVVVEFSRYSEQGTEYDEYACIRGASYFMSDIYLDHLLSSL